jgi:hypothetical protein
VWGDFRFGEFAYGAPELLLFVAKRKVHNPSGKQRR